VIRQQGGRPILVETPDALVNAVDYHFPVLVLVDLNLPGDWASAIRRCKLRPHTKQIPIYAYGSHVDTATLAAARKAGADHAWARSKMMEGLATVVEGHLHPSVRYPQGWDEALHPEAAVGVEEFNAGHYFEQHEHFETAWMAEPRPIRDLYQGVLQVGLAFLQIEQGNWAGALKMFRRGLPRLRDLPPVCQGIDLASLRGVAEALHREVTELGPARLAEFDQGRFPKIEIVS
jgi:predicted metal-dependent hydrolase